MGWPDVQRIGRARIGDLHVVGRPTLWPNERSGTRLHGCWSSACLAVAGIAALFRQPNPYTRSYYRYELMDVPEVLREKLDGGPTDWMWQVVPMVVVGIILLPFFA